MPQKPSPKKTNTNQYKTSKVGVGVGLGLAAAVAAGSYFLYGTKAGAKRRKQLRGWAVKAKGEVMERIEHLRDIDETKYHKLIDDVLGKYKKLKHVDTDEVRELADDLKKHWTNIQKQMNEVKKTTPKKPSPRRRTKKEENDE